MENSILFFKKYLYYKEKYLKLLNQQGGTPYRWYYEDSTGYKPFTDIDNIK
jgi:hypothetical protein